MDFASVANEAARTESRWDAFIIVDTPVDMMTEGVGGGGRQQKVTLLLSHKKSFERYCIEINKRVRILSLFVRRALGDLFTV